ncbi:MAG: YHS domain-containing protein [Bacillota bacterium]
MAECLPCRGHKIEVTATTPHAQYAGRTYYFCSDGCRDTFLSNPEKYVAKSPATQPVSAADPASR